MTATVHESADTGGWGNAWVIALIAALGVLMVSCANALSRTGRAGGDALFWAGVVVIILPITWGVMRDGATRSERLVLLVTASLALYAVKVMRDPFAFTFSDEFVHQFNADEIVRTGRLFGRNSILPITPYYPGLATATAALASLTGMATFGAGLIVIGSARVLATLALFLLVGGVLRSDRAAALAVLAYVAVPNYLFFTAQFAYESLALPIALLIVAAAVRAAGATEPREARAWTTLAVMLVPAVVVTHHLTSYALLLSLTAWCVVTSRFRDVAARRAVAAGQPVPEVPPAPVALTVSVGVGVAGWLVYAGRRTSDYLWPVIRGAISQTWGVLSGGVPTRSLFASSAGNSTSPTAPLLERVVGIGAVAVLVVWLVLGLLALRRSGRRSPLLLLLVASACAYVATFPLRFVPAAWETAGRASEFLFVGVATVLAATVAPDGTVSTRRRTVVVPLAVSLLAVGGVIAGWQTDRRVSEAYRVDVAGRVVEPELIAFGRWSALALTPGARVATEPSDARVLQLYGRLDAIAGRKPDVDDILHLPTLDPWMLEVLRDQRFRYVAVDRRLVSSDNMAGYFFGTDGSGGDGLRPERVYEKFDRAGAVRVFDSGDIVLYDIQPLLE